MILELVGGPCCGEKRVQYVGVPAPSILRVPAREYPTEHIYTRELAPWNKAIEAYIYQGEHT